MQTTLAKKSSSASGLKVLYERTFLVDLKQITLDDQERIQQFVFEEFYQIKQLQSLPGFRRINASDIFYRFKLNRYLICLEVTGQVVKFLRILPQPDL